MVNCREKNSLCSFIASGIGLIENISFVFLTTKVGFLEVGWYFRDQIAFEQGKHSIVSIQFVLFSGLRVMDV